MAQTFFVCESGHESVATAITGKVYPVCDSGYGAWITEADMLGAVGVDAEQIGYAFGWGFAAVVLCWFFGWTLGLGISVIKQA